MAKGYKLIPPGWDCKGQVYTAGRTAVMKEKPVLCERGFHFCTAMKDCLLHYRLAPGMHMCEVEALGDIDGPVASGDSKCCTNKLRIIREIPFDELMRDIIKHELVNQLGY